MSTRCIMLRVVFSYCYAECRVLYWYTEFLRAECHVFIVMLSVVFLKVNTELLCVWFFIVTISVIVQRVLFFIVMLIFVMLKVMFLLLCWESCFYCHADCCYSECFIIIILLTAMGSYKGTLKDKDLSTLPDCQFVWASRQPFWKELLMTTTRGALSTQG